MITRTANHSKNADNNYGKKSNDNRQIIMTIKTVKSSPQKPTGWRPAVQKAAPEDSPGAQCCSNQLVKTSPRPHTRTPRPPQLHSFCGRTSTPTDWGRCRTGEWHGWTGLCEQNEGGDECTMAGRCSGEQWEVCSGWVEYDVQLSGVIRLNKVRGDEREEISARLRYEVRLNKASCAEWEEVYVHL